MRNIYFLDRKGLRSLKERLKYVTVNRDECNFSANSHSKGKVCMCSSSRNAIFINKVYNREPHSITFRRGIESIVWNITNHDVGGEVLKLSVCT